METDTLPLFALARASDPVTSHIAAAELPERVLTHQLDQVEDALRRFPNCTSYELAVRAGLDRHMVAKRLSVLVRQGRAVCCLESERRACGISGKSALTWRIP